MPCRPAFQTKEPETGDTATLVFLQKRKEQWVSTLSLSWRLSQEWHWRCPCVYAFCWCIWHVCGICGEWSKCCVCMVCVTVISKTQLRLFAAGSHPSWITVQYFQEKMAFRCWAEYWLGQRDRCLSPVSASASSSGYSWLPRSLKDRRLKLHVASLLS